MPALQLHLDCKLSPAYLTLDLAENLQLLEPCGTDNPAALFGLFHLQLVSVSPLGAEGKHLRLEAEKKGRRLRIVQFGVKPEDFPYVPGDLIDCAVQISKNPYKGKVYLSVRAADVRRSGTDGPAVMVGDRRFDVAGAHENGLPAIGVLYGYGSREELENAGADYLAADLHELKQLLLQE